MLVDQIANDGIFMCMCYRMTFRVDRGKLPGHVRDDYLHEIEVGNFLTSLSLHYPSLLRYD